MMPAVKGGQGRGPVQEVAVDGRAVMEQLHERYGQLIAQLMAENANVAVAFETVSRRNQELTAQLEAAKAAAGVTAVRRPESPLAPATED